MYDEILVPTDGSRAAEQAIEHAVDIASQYGARIHALYVVDASAYSSLEAGSEVVMDALEEEGEEAVDHVAARAAEADVDVETTVIAGAAYRSILRYADDNDIDLIVMGTHGRQGLDRYLLGSVTERIVRTSDVPVLTIRMQDEE
ncbi:MAG: universal stress protein [Haloferacaceae archaeon]